MKSNVIQLLPIFLISLLTSCVDESSTVGDKWVDSSFRNVLTDTCSIYISTILADSITTSGDTITQIGHYADEYRGSIRGAFFSEYDVTTTSFNENDLYVFDSITITLQPTGDYLGDTLSTRQNISIHRIIENLTLIDNSYLYNTSTVKYEESPLTTFSFRPRPKSKEKLEVRLPDELGKEFFEMMEKQSIFFDSQDHFRLYFPGIAILPDPNDNCITGYHVNDSSMCITMYYREVTEMITEHTLTFKPSSTLKFNQSTQDFTNTPFEGIMPGTSEALASSKSQQMSCLQGLSGAYTKIEFPFLNNLLNEGEMVTIESAILYLYPVQQTYGDYIPLPETLTLYTANVNDVTVDVITNSSGDSVQDGSLVKDESLNKGAYYSFDITSFMQTNLGTFGINRQSLMLMLPNEKFLTTVESLILGDMDHSTSNIKIQIIYKAYNQ